MHLRCAALLVSFAAMLTLVGLALAQGDGPYGSIADLKLAKPEDGKDMAPLKPPAGAIVLSSLVWTALHLQYDRYFLGQVFTIGLLLGYLRYRFNSIWLTVIVHGLNNLAALAQTILLTGQG